jgi:hypothetical protein
LRGARVTPLPAVPASGLCERGRLIEPLAVTLVLSGHATIEPVERGTPAPGRAGALRIQRVDPVDDLVLQLVAVPGRPIVNVGLAAHGTQMRGLGMGRCVTVRDGIGVPHAAGRAVTRGAVPQRHGSQDGAHIGHSTQRGCAVCDACTQHGAFRRRRRRLRTLPSTKPGTASHLARTLEPCAWYKLHAPMHTHHGWPAASLLQPSWLVADEKFPGMASTHIECTPPERSSHMPETAFDDPAVGWSCGAHATSGSP